VQGYADPINGFILTILRNDVKVRQDVAIRTQDNPGASTLLPEIPQWGAGRFEELIEEIAEGCLVGPAKAPAGDANHALGANVHDGRREGIRNLGKGA
jgi:hypothetical protein